MAESMRVAAAVFLGAIALLDAACATHSPQSPREKFAYRVEEYAEMRRQAVQQVGTAPLTGSARTVDNRTDRLASAIEQFRSGFTRGVIFSNDIAAEFRRELAARLNAPDGDRVWQALETVSPPGYHPQVNAVYPETAPVEAMPPSLLKALPPLPETLAYRFVGGDLLLIDRDTRVVIDVLPEALPERRPPEVRHESH